MQLFKELPVEYIPTPNYWPGSSAGARYGFGIHNIGIHSTRSGRDYTDAQEYSATVSWFKSLASVSSTHSLVGDTRNIAIFYPVNLRYNQSVPHVTGPEHYAKYAYWHAGIGAKGVALTSMSLEIPQSFPDEPFEPDAIETAAVVVGHWCQLFDVPPIYLPSNSDFDNSAVTLRGLWNHEWVKDGKSDPGPMFPSAAFLDMVTNYVNAGGTTPDVMNEIEDIKKKLAEFEQTLNGFATLTSARIAKIDNEWKRVVSHLREV